MTWVFVETKDGAEQVVEIVDERPNGWRNISGVCLLTVEEAAAIGWFPVKATEPPQFDEWVEYLVDTVQKIDGVWTQVWTKEPYPPEERGVLVRVNLVRETQRRLDAFAQQKRYDSMLSLVSYVSSSAWGEEARYGVACRDDTWQVLFKILAEIDEHKRPAPLRYEEIEKEMPPLKWGELKEKPTRRRRQKAVEE